MTDPEMAGAAALLLRLALAVMFFAHAWLKIAVYTPAGAVKYFESLGVPGFFLETEPHLKGGGQFGGFSGPDGMGVAVRALCKVLDYVGIDYHLRDFDDIRQARGF